MTSPSVGAGIPVGTATGIVGGGSTSSSTPFPKGATPILVSVFSAGNASATATITPIAGRQLYLTGFEMSIGSATAGSTVNGSVSGLLGGTMTPLINVATAPTVTPPYVVEFSPPLPASGIGIGIAVTCPAGGAGAFGSSVSAHGYYI